MWFVFWTWGLLPAGRDTSTSCGLSIALSISLFVCLCLWDVARYREACFHLRLQDEVTQLSLAAAFSVIAPGTAWTARVLGVVGSCFQSQARSNLYSAKALAMIASGLKAALTDPSHPDDPWLTNATKRHFSAIATADRQRNGREVVRPMFTLLRKPL